MIRLIRNLILLLFASFSINALAQRADGHNVIYEMNVGMFTSQGTFAAAENRLSELHELGVDIVWLMPIYPRGNQLNSPYAVKDYKGVNSNYGTLANLKSFVTKAHSLGMQVWLDWVPNHTANEHPWVSTNREYYGGRTSPSTLIHPYPDVSQLNYYNDGLKNAMNDALKYWIDEADVDGYRFDYVSSGTIANSYWIATNPMLKSYKAGKTITLLAEADARDVSKIRNNGSNDFNFDYDYAWWFQETVLKNGFGSQDGNVSTLKSNCSSFVNDSKTYGLRRMVYLTNHDQNWNDGGHTLTDMYGDNRYALTVLTFTLYGMPLLYNGQEVGGNQKLDYFNDTKITWTSPDTKMQNTIKKLCAIKHSVNALHDEADATMLTTNNNNVLAFQRSKDDSRAVVVLNLGSSNATVTVSGITEGTYQKQLDGQDPAAAATNVTLAASQSFTIPAKGYQVYTVGEVTGIGQVTTDGGDLRKDNAVYDLSGRKVAGNGNSPTANSQLPKGIYISNGKKFVVK